MEESRGSACLLLRHPPSFAPQRPHLGQSRNRLRLEPANCLRLDSYSYMVWTTDHEPCNHIKESKPINVHMSLWWWCSEGHYRSAEGGCLGKELFVFNTRNHENHGNHEMQIWKQPPLNTINSSISRNHENHEMIFLKTTQWSKQPLFGAPTLSEAKFLPRILYPFARVSEKGSAGL